MLIGLLSSVESLATKCVSVNNELYMTIPAYTDLNCLKLIIIHSWLF